MISFDQTLISVACDISGSKKRGEKKFPSGESVRCQIDGANIAECAEASGEGALKTQRAFL